MRITWSSDPGAVGMKRDVAGDVWIVHVVPRVKTELELFIRYRAWADLILQTTSGSHLQSDFALAHNLAHDVVTRFTRELKDYTDQELVDEAGGRDARKNTIADAVRSIDAVVGYMAHVGKLRRVVARCGAWFDKWDREVDVERSAREMKRVP
jgi:hypothetical protein